MTAFNLMYAQKMKGDTTTHIKNYFDWIPADYIAVIEKGNKAHIRFFKSCYTRSEYNDLLCKFYRLKDFFIMEWDELENTLIFYTRNKKVFRNIMIKIRKERK